MRRRLVIIGGGMAGLTAAVYAGIARGESAEPEIVVLDANKEPGKKLLATGNGRCNITNRVQNEACYRTSAEPAVKEVFFEGCENWAEQVLGFFHSELGVLTHERQGYVYPRSDQAVTVQRALLRRADELGIRILSGVRAESMEVRPDGDIRGTLYGNESGSEPESSQKSCHGNGHGSSHGNGRACSRENECRRFRIAAAGLPSGKYVTADAVILAAGGMVSKAYGCAGDGYRLAAALGHRVTALSPSLCMLLTRDAGLKRLAGLRTTGEIRLFAGPYSEGQLLASGRGELQFTADGISGIPTFQVSRYAAGASSEHPVTAAIDFLPELSNAEWDRITSQRLQKAREEIAAAKRAVQEGHPLRGTSLLQDVLLGLVPDKAAAFLIERCGEIPERKLYKVPDPDRTLGRLLAMVRHTEFAVTGTPGFERAQVTAGGVSLSEITADMESGRVPGLFLAGELLDVDGLCGGYNLTFAFHSGAAAGKGALRRLRMENGDNKCWN